MVTIDDFIEIPFTDEIIKISSWIAERRVLYEYPGHAPDSERGRKPHHKHSERDYRGVNNI